MTLGIRTQTKSLCHYVKGKWKVKYILCFQMAGCTSNVQPIHPMLRSPFSLVITTEEGSSAQPISWFIFHCSDWMPMSSGSLFVTRSALNCLVWSPHLLCFVSFWPTARAFWWLPQSYWNGSALLKDIFKLWYIRKEGVTVSCLGMIYASSLGSQPELVYWFHSNSGDERRHTAQQWHLDKPEHLIHDRHEVFCALGQPTVLLTAGALSCALAYCIPAGHEPLITWKMPYWAPLDDLASGG